MASASHYGVHKGVPKTKIDYRKTSDSNGYMTVLNKQIQSSKVSFRVARQSMAVLRFFATLADSHTSSG